MSRTKSTLINFIANIISVSITILLSFILRTVFIKSLGNDFLGLNGLFTNIISILSLSELGIGTAIIFKLYKPLAENDIKRTIVLMNFYKKTYRIISTIIFISGLIIMPFLNIFIKDNADFINIYIVFFIFLIQTVSSYMFFAYKTSLIKADQKGYIAIRIETIINIFSISIQIIILKFSKNYYYYIISIVFLNIIKNYIISLKIDKIYPYLKHKINEKMQLSEVKQMFVDFASVFLYRINYVVIKSTDNVIISSFIGLEYVGIYSNYILITNTLNTIILTFYNAVKPSIGNLHADSKKSNELTIFNIINFITVILYGGAAIGIFIMSNSFISIWLGSEYTLPQLFPILISFDFYIKGIQTFLGQYRSSMGLFKQAKFRPIFSIIINLILSLILVNFWGIYGVLIGTICAILFTTMWYDPIIIFKNGFENSSKTYFLKNILYFIVVIATGIISLFVVNMVEMTGVLSFIIQSLLCVATSSIVFFLIFIKTKELKYIITIFKRYFIKQY